MIATHIHGKAKERLHFQEDTGRGSLAIFQKVDGPYPVFITCPRTPEFVTAASERSEVVTGPEKPKSRSMVPTFKGHALPIPCFHTRKFFA